MKKVRSLMWQCKMKTLEGLLNSIGTMFGLLIMMSHFTKAYRSGASSIVYFSVPTEDLAEKYARSLIENKFVACINILPKVTAVFPLDGMVTAETQSLVIAKTRSSRIQDVVENIKKTHPDSMPDIISTPIKTGNKMFLDWTLSIIPDNPNSCLKKSTRKKKVAASKSNSTITDNDAAINKKEAADDDQQDDEEDEEDHDNEDSPKDAPPPPPPQEQMKADGDEYPNNPKGAEGDGQY